MSNQPTSQRPGHRGDSTTTSHSRAARVGGAAAAVTVIGGTLFVGGQPAGAATFEVTTLDPAGAGSLAERIDEANAAVGPDTITFAPGLTGELDIGPQTLGISDDLTIVGPGSSELTLTNQDTNDVLYLYNGASLTVSGLTFDDAANRAVSASAAGDLTLADVRIVDARGNGLEAFESGAVTIVDSLITRSGGVGLKVDTGGDVTVTDTTLSLNGADGAYLTAAGNVVLTGVSTVSNDGNGIDLDNVGTVTMSGLDMRLDDDDAIDISVAGATTITDITTTLTDTVLDAFDIDGPLTIERLTADRSLDDVIDVSTVSGDVTIRNTSMTNIYNVGIDLRTVGAEATPANIVIDDVTMRHMGEEGIEVGTVFGSLTVTDSSFVDVFEDYAIDVFGVRETVTVERVEMTTTDGGVDITSSGSATLRDLSATNMRSDALDVSVTGDLVLERMSVVDVYDGSVDLSSSEGTVTVSAVTTQGMHDEVEIDGHAGVTVSDVNITDVLDDGGLDLDSNTGDILAERISVDFADGDGVSISDAGGDVTLRDISVANVTGDGLDVRSVDGETMVERITVFDAQADGILVETSVAGNVSISDATISSVDSDGVRARNQAEVNLTDVDVENVGDIGVAINTTAASLDGVTITGAKTRGLAVLDTADLTITNSTIADNAVNVVQQGGGIDLNNTTAMISASTITDNGGPFDGGAVFRRGGSSATVVSSIVVDNDGVQAFGDDGNGGTLTVENTLVDTGTGLGGTTIETDDALLGPVQDNGGPTRTAKPAKGSPAIDAVTGVPEPIDQRGVTRPQGAAADLGAVEIVTGVVEFDLAAVSVDEAAGVAELTLIRSGGADGAATVDVATADGTAAAGEDFTAIAETVEFADQATTATVSVPIADDGNDEADETFAVSISNPTIVSLAAATAATVTITDNDVAPEPEPEPEVDPDAVIATLAPSRFADTRPNGETFDDIAEKTGKLSAGGEIVVPIAGRGGVPADAVGVVMNVTAIQAEGSGFVTAHACLADRPNTSALNYTAGVNLGNEVIASLDGNGNVCLFSSAAAHLTVDVVGYVSATSPLQTVTPARLVDTRDTGATVDGDDQGGGTTDAGENRTINVGGRAGVPEDAAAVIVNVTAVGATSNGFITVHPCVDPVPTASSLNHVAGVNRGNELVASLDANGDLCVFTSASVNLTVDVVGYIPAGTNFAAVAPARLLDSRPGEDTVDGQAERETKLAANEEITLPVAGRAGVPDDATAAIVNITAVAAEGTGFVTAHPCVEPRPVASSLNFVGGVNGGNEVIASLDENGDLCLFASATTHLTVDIVGYLA